MAKTPRSGRSAVVIVRYVQKQGVKDIPHSREVIVRWLANDGREGGGGGREEGGDFVRRHSAVVVVKVMVPKLGDGRVGRNVSNLRTSEEEHHCGG